MVGGEETHRPGAADEDAERYSAAEFENPELAEFVGGDRVVITTTVGTILVGLLIVLLI